MKTVASAAILAAAAAISGPASAQIVLDQNATIAAPSGPSLNGNVIVLVGTSTPPASPRNPNPQSSFAAIGQTVTAGVSGRLTSIELQGLGSLISGSGAFLGLFNGNLAAGGTLIGAAYAPIASQALSLVTFDVSGLNYHVAPGQLYSFGLTYVGQSGPAANFRALVGTFAGANPPAPPTILNYNQYAGGQGYRFLNGGPAVVQPWDIGFRTFVDLSAAAVPEPSSWLLMIFGFGLVGATMRTRQRRGFAFRG